MEREQERICTTYRHKKNYYTDKVTYSTDNKNWSSQMPVVKDVEDSTDIYIRVEITGRAR